jgi:hypothetical protein
VSRRIRSGEAGYVSVYVALVCSLVLVPLVMFVIDLTTLAYHRTKLKSTADSLALAAVAESRSFHIPIPTEWIEGIPVNGWLLNGLHLKNLGTSIGLGNLGGNSEVNDKLKRLARLSADTTGPKPVRVEVGKAHVAPLGNFFFPYMYVKIPVEAEVKLQTPFLAQLAKRTSSAGTVTLRAEGCAVAWYRVDSWAHKWWDLKNSDSFVKTIDAFINVTDEPHKYYKLVNCVDEVSDMVSLAEDVITEHLRLQGVNVNSPWEYLTNQGKGDVKEQFDKWRSPYSTDEPTKRAKDYLEKGPSGKCRPGDPCVEADRDSIEGWSASETERRKAEEAAEKARLEAARKAQEAAEGGSAAVK